MMMYGIVPRRVGSAREVFMSVTPTGMELTAAAIHRMIDPQPVVSPGNDAEPHQNCEVGRSFISYSFRRYRRYHSQRTEYYSLCST